MARQSGKRERLLREMRRLDLPEWHELPRQAHRSCGSVRWVTLERHESPYRYEERLCTDCGGTFNTGAEWLDKEAARALDGRP